MAESSPIRVVGWDEAAELARKMAARVDVGLHRVYGIPRGGTYVAAMLAANGVPIAASPAEATLLVDDIIDSGRTARVWHAEHGLETIALFDRDRDGAGPREWIEFPWEIGGIRRDSIDTITRLLQQIGDDPSRLNVPDSLLDDLRTALG